MVCLLLLVTSAFRLFARRISSRELITRKSDRISTRRVPNDNFSVHDQTARRRENETRQFHPIEHPAI